MEGEVRLNTLPIIARVLQEVVGELRDVLPNVNVPSIISEGCRRGSSPVQRVAGDRVPDDFGQVTLMSEERLNAAQATADRIDRWVWGIVILTIILIVVTVFVSQTRRRTGIQLAIGIAVAFVVSAAVVNRVESALVAAIANPVAGETAAILFGHLLAGLRTGIIALIVISTVVALVLYLVGRPQWVTTTGVKISTVMPGSSETGGMNDGSPIITTCSGSCRRSPCSLSSSSHRMGRHPRDRAPARPHPLVAGTGPGRGQCAAAETVSGRADRGGQRPGEQIESTTDSESASNRSPGLRRPPPAGRRCPPRPRGWPMIETQNLPGELPSSRISTVSPTPASTTSTAMV